MRGFNLVEGADKQVQAINQLEMSVWYVIRYKWHSNGILLSRLLHIYIIEYRWLKGNHRSNSFFLYNLTYNKEV